jgi:transcription elongation factor Elf1
MITIKFECPKCHTTQKMETWSIKRIEEGIINNVTCIICDAKLSIQIILDVTLYK